MTKNTNNPIFFNFPSFGTKKTYFLLFFFTFFLLTSSCIKDDKPPKSKLIVGIVVDQMRYEYLYRFQDNYGENGFKRLMHEGFNVRNMHYNYLPTYTGPGHASIYTGTTPKNHGIIANHWYDRASKKTRYCAEDSTATLVPFREKLDEKTKKEYARSPKNLLTTTITDELKLFSNKKSKVIGLSIKDRGAIFPAGHLADYAFWYERETGDFITSSYYAKELPSWLVAFNNKKLANSLLNQIWDTKLPIENYVNSNPDDSPYEYLFKGKSTPTFPYNLKELRAKNGDFKMLPNVPFGNTILTQLALETIKGEKLGQENRVDFLSISYSSTDYIGHSFGIRSKEIEDTYVRLDEEIALLLDALDEEIGEENYIVFLTADHAASDYPSFLKDNRISSNFFKPNKIREELNDYLNVTFGRNEYIKWVGGSQIYLHPNYRYNQDILTSIEYYLNTEVPGLKETYIPNLTLQTFKSSFFTSFFQNGYNKQNSGDIFFHFDSGWMPQRAYGTTHGHTYSNDTHVPNLWYGGKIQKGESYEYHTIDQIAPTLSQTLDLPFTSSSSKNVMKDVLYIKEKPVKQKRQRR